VPRGTIQNLLRPDPGGVREDLSPALLPEGWYLATTNWLHRRGKGRPRPGYTLHTTATDALRVIGLGFRGSKQLGNNLVIFTLNHQYHFDGTTLSNISHASYTTSATNQLVRSLTFTQGGTDYILAVNAANDLMEWSGTGVFTTTSGSPPSGKDVFILGNRVVVCQPDGAMYRVRWSGFGDRTSWPTTVNQTDLRDTSGNVIGGAPFSPNTAAIYKDDCIYLATLQAAQEPFQFQFVGLVPGPVSAGVIVNALGVHYWLGEDFSIYKFDGAEPKIVSAGLTKTIGTNINFSDRDTSFGFASITQDLREVWFFYPNRNGYFNAVSCNILTNALNHHTFGKNVITAASEWRMGGATIDGLDSYSTTIDGLDSVYATIDAMDGTSPVNPQILLGASNGEVHIFNETYLNDNGSTIAWNFRDRWIAPGANQARVHVDAVDTLWTDTDTALSIAVGVFVTDKMSDTETSTISNFEVSTDEQHLLTFANKRGKMVSVEHSGSGVVDGLEYIGGILTSWPRGRV